MRKSIITSAYSYEYMKALLYLTMTLGRDLRMNLDTNLNMNLESNLNMSLNMNLNMSTEQRLNNEFGHKPQYEFRDQLKYFEVKEKFKYDLNYDADKICP